MKYINLLLEELNYTVCGHLTSRELSKLQDQHDEMELIANLDYSKGWKITVKHKGGRLLSNDYLIPFTSDAGNVTKENIGLLFKSSTGDYLQLIHKENPIGKAIEKYEIDKKLTSKGKELGDLYNNL
jgi:hypothetical protein